MKEDLIAISCLLAIAWSGPAQAENPGTNQAKSGVSTATQISPDRIVDAIRGGKIISPGFPLSANSGGHQVTVTTYRNPDASNNDCKIDAVLIAKQVIDLDSKNIARVNVIFHNYRNPVQFQKVVVTAGDVDAFGTGKIGQDTLLESLTLTNGTETNALSEFRRLNYKQILDSAEFAGPLEAERQQAFARIRSLQAKGLENGLLHDDLDDYLRVEDLCRHEHLDRAKDRLSELNAVLDEQEKKYTADIEPAGSGK
jgi:hypothetical protein